MDPTRLGMSVTSPDGTVTKWGYEEVDAAMVLNDLTFGTSMPGGFSQLACSLLRNLNVRPDESVFNTVRIYGPGNVTVWEGRLAQIPRQSGTQQSINPGAVGFSSHLEDFQGFMEVYADADPGSWGPPPLDRRIFSVGNAETMDKDYNASNSDGLVFTGSSGTLIPLKSQAELHYQAPPGCKIATVAYIGTEQGTTNVEAAQLLSASLIDQSTAVGNSLSLTSSVQVATIAAPQRYLALRALATAAHTPTAGVGLFRRYEKFVVYGNSGIPLQSVFGEPYHVLASDVIADVVSRAAPMLKYTTGDTGSIQPSNFTIPHLVFKEPTTAADVILRTNAYENWDWAVWNDRTFYYRPPDAGTQWEARLDEGAILSLEGDTADQIINGVVVSYTQDGVQRYAGPVGSGMDVESDFLADVTDENPVNAHGIPRRWPVLSLSMATTDAGAVQLGAIWLAYRNAATRKGQLVLPALVRHPEEGLVPSWRVRAGDTVVVSDAPNSVVRKIINTGYSHSGRQNTLDLDSTPHMIDALFARLLGGGG